MTNRFLRFKNRYQFVKMRIDSYREIDIYYPALRDTFKYLGEYLWGFVDSTHSSL